MEDDNQKIEKRNKTRKFLNWLMMAVVVVLVGWGVMSLTQSVVSEKPGEAVSIQPADHIKPGDPIPGLYLTNPPVSGWHYADTAEWGIHNEEVVDQLAIHNLEHGGIWITYTPDAPPELIEKLKAVAGRYKKDVVLSPRTANDSLIALAAWGRLDKFNYFDEARIIKFIKAYQGRGPEN